MHKERRLYYRHPLTFPLSYEIVGQLSERKRSNSKNLSEWGICFHSDEPIEMGTDIIIKIWLHFRLFKLYSKVIWCEKDSLREGFEIGVNFYGKSEAYKARMTEQLVAIETYRVNQLKHHHRILTEEEASREWIEKYARDYLKELG